VNLNSLNAVHGRERVPFNDLALQWQQIEAKALPDLKSLFEASTFCLGPWVEQFEKDIAAYIDTPHAIGVNSGTSALHLAMITAGVGSGDKVLVPANTFVATVWAVLYVGAEPVFCDVDPASWTIDPRDAERRMSSGVKAIIPVHLYGQPANMDAIVALARRHDLCVVEDVAQAFGARYGNRQLGTVGRLGCFSFYPGKNLGAAGEAGLVITADDFGARRIRALRSHAQTERYIHGELGFNYRMDGIQGLILGHKLALLDGWTNERRRIAKRYLEELAGLPLELPRIVNGDHVWHLFVVHTPERDRLRAHLAGLAVDTGLHYAVPLHRQPCFAKLDFDRDSFPNADRNARECLSLPIFAGMTDRQVDAVINGVQSFFHPA
jgi:dTDP-4-amino-4,6-dideoxygalactose transaminase